ncbi:DJ-1 protein-PfpI domain-containing protein [Mycena indigotica]|uniref:D-lactate dehydratase n=1 Tax=Mycena indigotica TaxID=2126181 RepID=A0A8H6W6P7_9AGAR|nr:DJ-1 protein-PfpI domain-containing protein [Mycena indigotica]KAF7301314.1 DJ-1 protein-PfpI domain-containing protein [Mycena indigotica]
MTASSTTILSLASACLPQPCPLSYSYSLPATRPSPGPPQGGIFPRHDTCIIGHLIASQHQVSDLGEPPVLRPQSPCVHRFCKPCRAKSSHRRRQCPGQSMFASDAESTKFLGDETVKSKLASAKKLSDVNAKDYDAIFYVGGHGPVIDLASDPVNIALASQFYQSGKITSAVCHGPAALVGVTDTQGNSIFAGKAATGFSDAEEIQVDKVKDVPFLLEQRITELGGKYEKAAEPWGAKVVVDGNLITGQNPASAAGVGEKILEALSK